MARRYSGSEGPRRRPNTLWDELKSRLGLEPRAQRTRRGERYVARPAAGTTRSAMASRRTASHRGGAAATRPGIYGPYGIGFLIILMTLALFVYIGLNWATGSGKSAGLATSGTPGPLTAGLVPGPSPVVALPSPSPSPSPVTERTYIVRSGDNLSAIATQFGVSIEDIQKANNISDPRKIQAGQSLKIPTPASR